MNIELGKFSTCFETHSPTGVLEEGTLQSIVVWNNKEQKDCFNFFPTSKTVVILRPPDTELFFPYLGQISFPFVEEHGVNGLRLHWRFSKKRCTLAHGAELGSKNT